MLECKETREGTLNFSKISQLQHLKDYDIYEGVLPYIIIWYSTKDKIIACPVAEAVKMVNDGLKSISLKMLQDSTYNIIDLPVIKKRVYVEADFTKLLEYHKKEE